MNKKTRTIIVLVVMIAIVLCLFAFIKLRPNEDNRKNNIANSTNKETINEDLEEITDNMGKTLIAYFSWSGNTEDVASAIYEKVGGDIVRIEPKTEYPKNNSELTNVVQKEKDEKARPELKNNIDNIDDYDIIFLGHPIWLQDMPMIMYSFIEQYDLSGKTIVNFGTYGGTGLSESTKVIQELEPNAKVIEGIGVKDSETNNINTIVNNWFKTNSIITSENNIDEEKSREILLSVKPEDDYLLKAETERFNTINDSNPFDAKELYEQFIEEPEDSLVNFKEKSIEVSGIASKVGADIHGNPSIELSDQVGGFKYVLCVFRNNNILSQVKEGDKVTIRGNYLVFNEDYGITLKNSEILK